MVHHIRLAAMADSGAILKIYAPFITDTAVSFETEVPAEDAFAQRVNAIREQYPYLVDQVDGEIVGFAYASRHRQRSAYRYDVDCSIYVLPRFHGTGAAHRLYGCLFELLEELGYYNAYAAYTVPNEQSMRFHLKFGFSPIGTFHKTGYKFGSWHDVTWLEKHICSSREAPARIRSVGELPEAQLQEICSRWSGEKKT